MKYPASKSFGQKSIRLAWMLLILVLFAFSFVNLVSAQDTAKLESKDVLAKHIESIGSSAALTAATNRKIEGTVTIERIRVPNATLMGGTLLASATNKQITLFAVKANNPGDYSGERIAYDGNKLDIPFVTAAQRSSMGSFIFNFPEISKGYIFGGVLFSSWALLDPSKIGKFELMGKDKIDDVETYKIKFLPKGGTSLNIRMFFDAKTFRHLRTEYSRIESARTLVADEGRYSENRFKLIEDFSDFRRINDLMLPTTYRITFRIETFQMLNEFQWNSKLTRFAFDPSQEPGIFSVK